VHVSRRGSDDGARAEARMDLATCYEALKDRARAVETLARAAALRPGDAKPLHRLSDLHLRQGEWKGAVEACGRRRRAFTTPPSGPRCICESDRSCAISGATRRARRRRSGVPPSSIRWGRGRARWWRSTMPPAISAARWTPSITRWPMSGAPSRRIPSTCGGSNVWASCWRWRAVVASGAPIAEAAAAVASVLDLVKGEGTPDAPAGRPHPIRAQVRAGLLGGACASGVGRDFAGELWPNLAEAAMELFPAPPVRGKRQAIPPGHAAAAGLDRDQRHRAGSRRVAHPAHARAGRRAR
jgi:hypothetical protein